jgi:hypothetical protein
MDRKTDNTVVLINKLEHNARPYFNWIENPASTRDVTSSNLVGRALCFNWKFYENNIMYLL